MKYNLTQEQKKHYLEYGYLIIEDFLPLDVANKLLWLHRKTPYWSFAPVGCEELGPEFERFGWNEPKFNGVKEFGQVDSRDIPEEVLEKINKIKQYHQTRRDYGYDEDGNKNWDDKPMGRNCWQYAPQGFLQYKNDISKQITEFNYEELAKYLVPIHHSLQSLSLSKLTDDIESNRHYFFDFIWSKYDYLSYIGNHEDTDFEWVEKYKDELEKYPKAFLNSGLYVNDNWDPEYGGQLCLKDLKGNIVEVAPKFNSYIGWSQTPMSETTHCVNPVQHKTRSRRAIIVRDMGISPENSAHDYVDQEGKYYENAPKFGRRKRI